MERKVEPMIDAAVAARDRAITFNTAVGVAYETYDGEIYAGFNVETFIQKSYHAEEMGLIRALADGYVHTDLRRMVEVYQDASHDETELYPGCPNCWGYWREFAHPYFEVIVADTTGDVHYSAPLHEILDLPGRGEVYPSNLLRENKNRRNTQPLLPLDDELHEQYREDDNFRKFCNVIGVELPDEV